MEPERRIEKWLRAFAKKRREQAGETIELRPAARARLQREIARQAEEKSRGGFFSQLFFGLRPRLAFAVCFLVLIVGGLILWPQLNHQEPATLSMNKLSQPETSSIGSAPKTAPPPVMNAPVAGEDKKVLAEKLQPVPTAPQPTAPTVASANRALKPAIDLPAERNRAQSAQKQLTVTTTAASAPPTNLYAAFKNETAADSAAAAGALATTPVPPGSHLSTNWDESAASQQTTQTKFSLQTPPPAAPASTALFDVAKATGTPSSRTASQVFNRLVIPAARRNATLAPGTGAPVVLTSFRVEQSGNNMKVVDADGSVYTGSVQIAQQEPPAATRAVAPKNQPASQLKTAAPAPQNYFFRVAGTNRNLNQNVVFSGNFVPLTNSPFADDARSFSGAAGFGGVSGVAGGGAPGGTTGQPIEAVLPNSQINGTVIIGDQKPIDMIATPAH